MHIHPSHTGHLDSANSIEEKDKIIEITGLQNLAKSLSAQHCGKFSVLWIAQIAGRETEFALTSQVK